MLSEKRKEELRKMLLEKKREVWEEVKSRLFEQLGKNYREEIETALDEGDKALTDLAEETGLSLVDLRKDILDKIDHALEKLENGTYGICEDCGAEISTERLKAMPFAIYCVPCKEKREELEKIERERERLGAPAAPEFEEET